MYKMLNMYYNGQSIYEQTNLYSRYTRQFLHYLYMFNSGFATSEDVDIARDYMTMFQNVKETNLQKWYI